MSIRVSLIASVGGRYAGVAVQLAGSILLARLIPPSEFGVFGVAVAVVALSTALREFGVSNYVVQLRNIDREALGRATGMIICATLALGLPLFLARGWIAEIYKEPRLKDLIGLMSISIFLTPFGAASIIILQRELKFALLSAINLFSSVISIVVSFVLALYGMGAFSLAWGQVISTVLSVLLLILARRRDAFYRPIFSGWGAMINFGLYTTLSSSVHQIYSICLTMILGRSLGFSAVGIYDRANSMAQFLNRDLTGSIMQVVYVGLARLKEQPEQLTIFARTTIANLIGILWPAYALLAVLAEPMVIVLYGDSWKDAGPIVSILCIGNGLSSLVALHVRALLVFGAARLIFIMDVGTLGSRLLILLFLAKYGLILVVWVYVIYVVIGVIVYLILCKRYLPWSNLHLFTVTIQSLLLTVSTALPAYLILVFQEESYSGVIVLGGAAIAGGLGWIITVFALRHQLGRELGIIIQKTYSTIRAGLRRPK